MKKIITHLKRWNVWRKNCLNSPFYKLLVLFKIVESPSMPLTWTKEEQEAFYQGFLDGLNGKE